MTRLLLAIPCILFWSILQAAPVPTDKAEKRKELEALWADLYQDEPASSTAVLKLFKQPTHTVPFLKEKLRPLKLEVEACKRLLKDLGSDDAKVWKTAWDELDYLDPRLAIDLMTLMDGVTAKPARTRMVELCSGRKANSLADQDVQIRPLGGGEEGYNFSSKMGSWWAEHRIDRLGTFAWQPKQSWTRAARGVAILEQLGGEDAVKVLELLATGHPDAFPTKAAKESLERLKK